jgi:hypothetical protein
MWQLGQKQTRCFAPVGLLPPGADICPARTIQDDGKAALWASALTQLSQLGEK